MTFSGRLTPIKSNLASRQAEVRLIGRLQSPLERALNTGARSRLSCVEPADCGPRAKPVSTRPSGHSCGTGSARIAPIIPEDRPTTPPPQACTAHHSKLAPGAGFPTLLRLEPVPPALDMSSGDRISGLSADATGLHHWSESAAPRCQNPADPPDKRRARSHSRPKSAVPEGRETVSERHKAC